jgi:hypothetical protein
MEELQLMYANLQRFGCSTNSPEGTDSILCATRKGNFLAMYYWSSSENGSSGAWLKAFSNGYQNHDSKNYNTSVRAVRAF